MALLISNISRLSTLGSCRQLLFPRATCFTIEQKAGLKQTVEDKLNLPAKPKKPLTPFFRFLNLNRPSLKEKHPDLTILEVSKKLSQSWETADPKLKHELNERYQKEMEAYAQAKIKYNVSLTDEQKEAVKQVRTELAEEKKKRRLKKKAKELGKPKRPVSSYMLFALSKKDQRGNSSVYDWQLHLSKEWETMSEEQKRPYIEQSKKAFMNYSKEMEVWENSMIKEGHLDVVRTEVLEPKAKKQTKK